MKGVARENGTDRFLEFETQDAAVRTFAVAGICFLPTAMQVTSPLLDMLADRASRWSLRVVESGDLLEIRHRWIRIDSVLLALVAPFPVWFLLSLALACLQSGDWSWRIAGVLVGVLVVSFLYALAANLLNVTVLRITADRLEQTSWPLPCFGVGRRLSLEEISGPSGEGKIHLTRRYERRHIDYRLGIVTLSGRRIFLLRSFQREETAERARSCLARRLER